MAGFRAKVRKPTMSRFPPNSCAGPLRGAWATTVRRSKAYLTELSDKLFAVYQRRCAATGGI